MAETLTRNRIVQAASELFYAEVYARSVSMPLPGGQG